LWYVQILTNAIIRVCRDAINRVCRDAINRVSTNHNTILPVSDKFLNKYRIPSARLQTWDYGNDGAYYITICTNGRIQYFGEITCGEMILNGTGKLAERFWSEIPNHFPFIELDNFVIMPNHVHGILIINRCAVGGCAVETRLIASLHNPHPPQPDPPQPPRPPQPPQPQPSRPQPPQPQPQPEKPGGFAGHKNPMCHNNISRIIRWYKGRCSFEINKIHPVFAWQPRFYEHIIRDAAEWERIRIYIADNPANWKEGKSREK